MVNNIYDVKSMENTMVMTFGLAETFFGLFSAIITKTFLSYCLAYCP